MLVVCQERLSGLLREVGVIAKTKEEVSISALELEDSIKSIEDLGAVLERNQEKFKADLEVCERRSSESSEAKKKLEAAITALKLEKDAAESSVELVRKELAASNVLCASLEISCKKLEDE